MNKGRVATGGITEEIRKMEVGDIVYFPIPKYNYNSIRSTSHTTLLNDTLEGCKWTKSIDRKRKCIVVTRIA